MTAALKIIIFGRKKRGGEREGRGEEGRGEEGRGEEGRGEEGRGEGMEKEWRRNGGKIGKE